TEDTQAGYVRQCRYRIAAGTHAAHPPDRAARRLRRNLQTAARQRGFPMWDYTAEPSPADTARRRNPDPQGPWSQALGRGRCSLLSNPGRRPAGPCNKVNMGVSLGCCSAEPPRARRYQEGTPDCPTSTSPPTLSAEPFHPTGEGTRSWLRFFMCSAMWLRAALILATLRLSL
ncbi:MAG: hypothetical protein QOF70_7942, partial [Acetobacteraceae bacterium]|nr:hypothetical protein [Acetobacteraceae bacterium]